MSDSKKKRKAPELDKGELEKAIEIFLKRGYAFKSLIGSGGFATVYRTVRTTEPNIGRECAVKIMDLSKMPPGFRAKFLPRELTALVQISHKHIIQAYDIFRTAEQIFVFMEYAPNRDLAKYIKVLDRPVSEPVGRYWFTQLTDAVQYLHESLFLVHRDIKVENILLGENYTVKLSDFGFTKESVDEEGYTLLSETFCGTRPYLSPQILLHQPYNPFKADTWAMGIVLYIILHNKFPFHFKDRDKMLREVQDPSYVPSRVDSKLSDPGRNLLIRLLESNELTRLGVFEVAGHEWLSGPTEVPPPPPPSPPLS